MMPTARGTVSLDEKKRLKCPHCGKEYEQEIHIEGEAEIEFDMGDYAPDYDEP
jgi:hypothetical protein